MEKIDYNQYFEKVMNSISNNGAFLTVKSSNSVNTMTIGWANIGYIWGKPVLTVAVRKSRYTYKLIENSRDFSVSIPFDGKMKNELAFCGSKSGKNYNKFAECDLDIISAEFIHSPLISGCDIHYECEIVYKQDMVKENLNRKYKNKYYENDDYHTLYYGEVINSQKEV